MAVAYSKTVFVFNLYSVVSLPPTGSRWIAKSSAMDDGIHHN